MYEIHVHTDFCAAHAITIDGAAEVVHGHNWEVEVAVAGERLDDDGLLCDFHLVERKLSDVVAPFRNADLNDTPPFNAINPTAELLARHIADRLAEALGDGLEGRGRVTAVSVTEAPRCTATYRPDPRNGEA